MTKKTHIVVHHTDTPDGVTHARWRDKATGEMHSVTYDAATINEWHRHSRGIVSKRESLIERPALDWFAYHGLVNVDGTYSKGRAENEAASGAPGYNAQGLHLCLVGRSRYTEAAQNTALAVVSDWMDRFDIDLDHVAGHRDVGGKGKCPGFPVTEWLKGGVLPLPGHIL